MEGWEDNEFHDRYLGIEHNWDILFGKLKLVSSFHLSCCCLVSIDDYIAVRTTVQQYAETAFLPKVSIYKLLAKSNYPESPPTPSENRSMF